MKKEKQIIVSHGWVSEIAAEVGCTRVLASMALRGKFATGAKSKLVREIARERLEKINNK